MIGVGVSAGAAGEGVVIIVLSSETLHANPVSTSTPSKNPTTILLRIKRLTIPPDLVRCME
jgi:hypothetical protein